MFSTIRTPLLALLVWLPPAFAATPGAAQVVAEPILRGAVHLGSAEPPAPPEGVAAGTVVLHRVGPDSAGEIDSTRVASDGTFSFRLPSVPDPGGAGEIFFASIEYDGILYFGDAIGTAVQLDSLYVIEVYDTIAAPEGGARLPVAVRYLVLEPATAPEGAPVEEGGGWRMTDLIQVENPGSRTLVPVDSGPVWSYPVPAGARRVQIGGGEVGPDATRVEGDRFVVRAPLPPGQRQLILRYTLDSPDVTLLLPGTTGAVELLVREPAPPLVVEGLQADQPVQMETGTTYRRFVGADLRDATVRIAEDEESGEGGLSPRWLAVVLGLILGAVGLWAALRQGPGGRRRGVPRQGVDTGEGREALLLEVARLDEALESGSVGEEEAERLRLRRASLLEELGGS